MDDALVMVGGRSFQMRDGAASAAEVEYLSDPATTNNQALFIDYCHITNCSI